MSLDYDAIMALVSRQRFSWTERDAIIYALGVGMADDPTDERELPFVRDQALKVLPTFPVVVAFEGGPLTQIGLDRKKVLHGEHAITLHRPCPPRGAVLAEGRMLGAWDKGRERGAIFAQEKRLFLEGDGAPLATIVTTVVGRAEGGFGGPSSGQPAPHDVPSRPADATVEIATLPKQALLYRLSGDLNPIHLEPAVAAAAGFERPILHGLCTFAICARAVLAAYCGYDPSAICHHQARFSAPVLPGDRISVDLWQDGEVVSFEARVPARNVTVIKGGKALIG